MEYIKVGHIVNTFGIRGELKVESLSDFTELRFRPDQELFIKKGNNYDSVIVRSVREHKGFLLVLFKGLENINLVEKYKDCDIYIHRRYIQALPIGEYYFFELNGCEVYHDNMKIGSVTEVEDGYQTVLRIATADKELLLPYVPAFVKNVDVANKRIDIDVIEGML